MPFIPTSPETQTVVVVIQPAQDEVVEEQLKALTHIYVTRIDIQSPMGSQDQVLIDFHAGYMDNGTFVTVKSMKGVRLKDATVYGTMTGMVNPRHTLRMAIKEAVYAALLLDKHIASGTVE